MDDTSTDKLLKAAAIEGGGRVWVERKITADEFWDNMAERFCTKFSIVNNVSIEEAEEAWDSSEVQRKAYKLICNIKTWLKG